MTERLIDALVSLWFWLTPQQRFSEQARRPRGRVGRFMMTRIFLRGNDPLNQFTLDCLQLRPNNRVLDIGFGPGKWLGEIAKQVPNGAVEGVDFSAEMVKQATAANREWIDGGRVRLYQGDCRDLPCEDHRFDNVFSVNTLYFWQPATAYLMEIYRVLKPGGTVALGFKSGEQIRQLKLSESVFAIYSCQQIIAMLTDVGFCDVRICEQTEKPFTLFCAIATKPC